MIVILGPTAVGKTKYATRLAYEIQAEIISADSRQVYRGMDIGTGKDLKEYIVADKEIPYHLINIVDPGYEYNIYEYKRDFYTIYNKLYLQKKPIILCGGSGMYIESILLNYDLEQVPENEALRLNLSLLSTTELIDKLQKAKEIHNTTDITDRKRLIRAIEISEYNKGKNKSETNEIIDYKVIGITKDRQLVREGITSRLKQRLEKGMIYEVQALMDQGLSPEQLMFYGLEYKFITQYLLKVISYDEMFRLLNTAIHQFAKRQMTWFRRMEKKGIEIHWFDASEAFEENIEKIKILI